MVAEVIIVNTEPKHVRALAPNLRDADKREILAFGVQPNRALWRSYKSSLTCNTALIDSKVVAMWGVAGSLMGEVGRPWLLTSPEVEKVSPLLFTRIYQKEAYKMLEYFPRLANFVDASYEKAVRLLDIIGFRLGEPEPIGTEGAMIRKFEMGA